VQVISEQDSEGRLGLCYQIYSKLFQQPIGQNYSARLWQVHNKIHGTLDGESHHTPMHEDSKQVFAKKPERLSLKNNQAASQMRRDVVLKPFKTRSYLQDRRGYFVEILQLFDVRTKRMLFKFPCLCNWRRTEIAFYETKMCSV